MRRRSLHAEPQSLALNARSVIATIPCHSQILVGNLVAVVVVEELPAILVGIQDTNSADLSVVEDGQLDCREEYRSVDIEREHGFVLRYAATLVDAGRKTDTSTTA